MRFRVERGPNLLVAMPSPIISYLHRVRSSCVASCLCQGEALQAGTVDTELWTHPSGGRAKVARSGLTLRPIENLLHFLSREAVLLEKLCDQGVEGSTVIAQ